MSERAIGPIDTVNALTMGIAALKTLAEHFVPAGMATQDMLDAAQVLKILQAREIRTKVNRDMIKTVDIRG